MEIKTAQDWLERFRLPLLIGFIGLVLIGIGVLAILVSSQKEDKIEIIGGGTTQEGTIFVDIEGAVEKPGLYELPFSSRLDDLLTKAGGLAAEADRDWVEKTLNRAQKLTDGQKIYIPKKGESVQGTTNSSATSTTENVTSLINVNTASASELDTLWGIGPATAQKIIENRPYKSVEELLTKKILKQNVYERNQQLLTVF